MRFLLLLSLCLLTLNIAFSANIKVYGNHPDYANSKIKVYCFGDNFSTIEEKILTIDVDSIGEFYCCIFC